MNSRLLNIPAILVAVLTISIGSYIYNSSQSTITDAVESLSLQETETFNSLFTMYEGEQTGSNVKVLIGKLISNANTYKDETNKVPYVYIDQLNETSQGETAVVFKERDEGDSTEYINQLNQVRNQINTQHEYYVEMTYQSNGLIDYIIISFDPLNKVNELMHRDQKTNLFDTNCFDDIDTTTSINDAMTSLSQQEIDAFNNQFISYQGEQTGSNIKALMGRLIGNADTYRDEPNKVPFVYIDQLNQTQMEPREAIFANGMDVQDYINILGEIRNKIETKHMYYVEITYQADSGVIDYIQISYDSNNPITDEMHR